MGAGDVRRPVELVGLVTAHDQDVGFVDHDDFAFADFLVENLETGPLEPLKIIEGVLVEFCEVKELLRNGLVGSIGASATRSLRLVHRPEVCYLLLRHFQLTRKVFHAIMLFLVLAAYLSYKLTVRTPENNRRTLVLVCKELLIRQYLLAAFVHVAAPKLYLAQQIPRHAVDAVELALVSAVGAGVWVLHEPMRLAITAQWLLAIFALDGVFQNVVADAADEFGEEGFDVLRIKNLIFFVDELLVLF